MKSPLNHTAQAIFLAVGILSAPAAFAGVIQYDFDVSGTTEVTALFQDLGSGQVQLTIAAPSLPGNTSVNSLFLNFNPLFDSQDLVFTQTAATGGVQGSVSASNDSFKTGAGSGKFDINVVFGTSPSFINGDTITYSITGIGSLNIHDFIYPNTATSGEFSAFAAVSLQEPSGEVIIPATANAVPETSSTLGLLASGLTALALLSRRLKIIKAA